MTPRITKRPWGTFETLAKEKNYHVKHIIIYPGERLSLQSHKHRDEVWTVVNGMGKYDEGDIITTQVVTTRGRLFISKETKHRMECISEEPLEFIEIQIGDYLEEDDITRYEDNYGRI